VILDGEARIGDAGRIGEREVALVHQALGRRDGDFSERGNPMILQCVAAQLLFHHVLPLSLSSRRRDLLSFISSWRAGDPCTRPRALPPPCRWIHTKSGAD